MSQKNRIRPLPRKRLPYGKFQYCVEFWNSRDQLNKRRMNRGFDKRLYALKQPDFLNALHQTLSLNIKGKVRLENNDWFFGASAIVERIWFENYSDLLIMKMLHPEHIRKIYRVELFD